MATEALLERMAVIRLQGAQHKIDGNFGSHSRAKKKFRRKKSLEQVILFSHKFIRDDAVDYFGQTWRQTLTAWDSLVRQTVIPPDIPVADLDITSAVNALNGAIAGKERTSLPPGSGYVQLLRFLDVLEGRVKADKKAGLIPSQSGRVNASIAFDMYLGAQSASAEALPTRSKMSEHRRTGRRWQELTGPLKSGLPCDDAWMDQVEDYMKQHVLM
ncbi:phosphotransferase family [Fusarium beomiforme]|uniref:Phosphotransferase family n=1 Tax=Fusarium beomiforme TaxID=44412 RepID=A0A9P5DZI3_9HYPO|nr:phosphotransferase family [Fusarium beomiforme]